MTVRLTDLSPSARSLVRAQLGLPTKRVRRKAVQYKPAPLPEQPTPTERQQEIQRIRRALSGIAARLTVSEGRVEWAVEAIRVELSNLETLQEDYDNG